MKTPLERATTRVEQQYKRNPEAVQLAKLVSLAVRVEPHLLRRLRLDLLPDADVGVEADLWFGPLVESRGVRTIVLDRYVVELLREKLAEDRQLLLRVIALTEQAHAEAATTIRLEERLTALAVLNDPDAPQKIDEALRPALRTMQLGGEDARQLAHWATRALSQAHPRVRESANYIALCLSATFALGGRPILREVPKAASDLGDLSWLLQGAISVPPTRVGVELVADGVAFAEPGGEQPQLALPATNPLWLSLSWKTDGGDAEMRVEPVPGRTVELDGGVTEVELRTLSGDEYLLSAMSPVESEAETTGEDPGARHFDIDVFISYIQEDNQPLSEEKGWVTMLRVTLQQLLSERMGREVNFWMDQKLRGANEFTNEVFAQLFKTAVVVSVLSPDYLNSDFRVNELDTFCRFAEETGGLVVDNRSRVFKVIKTSIDVELTRKLPLGVRDTLGYEFLDTGDGTKSCPTCSRSYTDAALNFCLEDGTPLQRQESRENFVRKVDDLANDIAQMLSRLSVEPQPQPPAKQSSGIFVSYRHDDSAGHTGRLFDKLVEHFGKDQVFMDLHTIQPGEDFVEAIENAVGSCKIVIVIIGRHWLSERLDNPNDFVRVEIAHALSRGIRVVPVLVQRASMPQQRDLPDDLAQLARRHAIELSDLRWQSDVDQLISVMERVIAAREGAARRRFANEPELPVEIGEEERAKQLSKIFISYRRDHTVGHTSRLYYKLVEHFGKDRVSMDVDIKSGEDIVKAVENTVSSCEILIAIIGPYWLSPALGPNLLPVDDPDDTAHMEIALALRRGIRVLPVLVQKASMPNPQDLPDHLAKLAYLNAGVLSDIGWDADVDQLISAIERDLAEQEGTAPRRYETELPIEVGEDERRLHNDARRSETDTGVRGASDQQPQPPAKQLSRIFLSFRYDDTGDEADRLGPQLFEHFRVPVSFDIMGMKLGEDFVTQIEEAVGACDIMIVIIGRHWLSAMDDRNDFIRLEIAYALRHGMAVIPVLVQGASMPTRQNLPNDLAPLARRNAIELSDLRWQSDVDQLISVMERVLAAREEAAPRRFGNTEPELPIEVGDEERPLHNDARRFARLLVSELKLYNEQKVKEGRSENNLYERLREEIDRTRAMYDKRVAPAVAARYDYFHDQLVHTLADGDARKLGPGYPGASVATTQ